MHAEFHSEAPVRWILLVEREMRGDTAVDIEIDHEEDGRWIAEIPDLPGVLTYGQSRDEVIAKAKALALPVLADRLENGESIPDLRELFAVST